MRRIARGLTILEVLVAGAILVIAMIPMLTTMGSSNRQMHQTSHYSIGMTLSDRVAEELRVASWENVHLADRVLADPDLGTPYPVVDGQSPFFYVIEDSEEPLGRMRAGEDRIVDRDHEPLYSLIRDFRIGATPSPRTLPTTGRVVDVSIRTEWPDHRGKIREFDLTITLGRRQALRHHPEAVLDRALADERIREILFPDDPDSTLDEAIVAHQADPGTVRDLGDLLLIVGGIDDTRSDHEDRTRELEDAVDASPDEPSRCRNEIALGRHLERRAKQVLVAMTYLAEPCRRLAEPGPGAALGDPSVRPDFWLTPTIQARGLDLWLRESMLPCEDAYLKAYERALTGALPGRSRIRLFLKLIDIHKTRLLLFGPQDVTWLTAALQAFADDQEGRNPNFFEFAIEELALRQSASRLEATYEDPRLLEAIETFRQQAPQVTAGIIRSL